MSRALHFIDFFIYMAEKSFFMVEKDQNFNSFVFGIPMITLDKLLGSENYLS